MLPSIEFFEGVALKKCVSATYNRMQVMLAPHILYTRHTRQSGDAGFRIASPEQISKLIAAATDDARLLLDRDGGLDSARGKAARVALYLFERDWGVSLLRSG